MRTRLRLVLLCAAIALCAPHLAASHQAEASGTVTIACRVLEAHTSAHPAVIAVVFHQRDKQDQAQLGTLLDSLAGESVEMQTGDGNWTDVMVVRLKSCFGRGLLLLPGDAPPLKERATFVLRFSSASEKN
jgi:hypothetical protein